MMEKPVSRSFCIMLSDDVVDYGCGTSIMSLLLVSLLPLLSLPL